MCSVLSAYGNEGAGGAAVPFAKAAFELANAILAGVFLPSRLVEPVVAWDRPRGPSGEFDGFEEVDEDDADRKSTRLNSSHVKISYAVFCLKKKKKIVHTYGSCDEC